MLEEAPDQRALTEQPNEPGFGSEMLHYRYLGPQMTENNTT